MTTQKINRSHPVPSSVEQQPIGKDDMVQFLKTESDFAFEMRVLKKLTSLGFACEHSGTYTDPVTGKTRQFDIRAYRENAPLKLGLAVECKNFTRQAPLLVLAAPRTSQEAFHQVFKGTPTQLIKPIRPQSFYRVGEFVGKKVHQVSYKEKGGASKDKPFISGRDEQAFDKIAQALNSLKDMVLALSKVRNSQTIRAAVPALVIPDGRLWQAEYSEEGECLSEPREVTSATFFINQTWEISPTGSLVVDFCVSHLEIITESAIPTAVADWFGDSGLFSLET